MTKTQDKAGAKIKKGSALDLLRTLISEDRRMHGGDIIARDATPKDIDFDTLPRWYPAFKNNGAPHPQGGAHCKTGMVNAIARKSKQHGPDISNLLNGRERPSIRSVAEVMNAVDASPIDKQNILRQLLVNNPFDSPTAFLTSAKFSKMNAKQAMGALVGCFVQNNETKAIMTIAEFIDQIPTIQQNDLEKFELLTEIALSEAAGENAHYYTGMKRGDNTDPIKQLRFYNILRLSSEQAALMLEKSWNPETSYWHRGTRTTQTYTTAEKIFTSPPEDDPERLKTKGELLKELREAHCVLSDGVKTQILSWKDAVREIGYLLAENGLNIFTNMSLRPMHQIDAAELVGRPDRQIVEQWEHLKTKITQRTLPKIIEGFNLSDPLATAFQEAPDTLEEAATLRNGSTHRENLAIELEKEDAPRVDRLQRRDMEEYLKNHGAVGRLHMQRKDNNSIGI